MKPIESGNIGQVATVYRFNMCYLYVLYDASNNLATLSRCPHRLHSYLGIMRRKDHIGDAK